MFKKIALTSFLALSLLRTPVAWAADGGKEPTLSDDRKALQGVWASSPEGKKQLQIMFLDDKVGYLIADPAAKPGASPLGFMALSAAQQKESKGKRSLDIEVAKDYVKHVEFRFEKGQLIIGLDGTEYKVKRLNARAADNPAAKKLLGSWKLTAAEFKGKEETPDKIGLEAIVFTNDRYILKGPGGKELLNSFYRVDADKKPAEMDWFGMKPDFVIPLLFEVKDDELRVTHPPFGQIAKGAKRPASFDTKESGAMLLRAKRAE